MSRVEFASKPVPVFAKLVVVLRNIPAMQFVLGKLAALLRKDKTRTDQLNTRFVDETPDITKSPGQQFAVIEPSAGSAIAAPPANDQSERENLIRRRWAETGIKMWNPDFHGAGYAVLNIQGRSELLPPKPGKTLPRYDTLEFKVARSNVNGQAVDLIVCEGVVVDPPKRQAGRLTAGAAMTIIGT